MNSGASLEKRFLDSLNTQQKGYLWTYHRLLTSPQVATEEKEAEQLCEIWKAAETDDLLRHWLELIDYFYTNVSSHDDVVDENRRAFASEYIELLCLEKAEKQDDTRVNKIKEIDAAVLLCPDGSGFVIVDRTELSNNAYALCSHCNEPLWKHQKPSLFNNGIPPEF